MKKWREVLITEHVNKEELSIEFNVDINVTAIDGEKLSITFLTLKKVNEDITKGDIGEFVGTIDVLYPVAGLNVGMTLDVYCGLCHTFNIESGLIKLPFIDKRVSIEELEYELYHQLVFDDTSEETYEKCSCGGNMRSMYDEFPQWIKFCTKCDCRTENIDCSPMPY